MNVLRTMHKGHHVVARVEVGDIPRSGLRVGILVHQGELAWKVSEVAESSVWKAVPGELDLVLRPDGHDLVPATGALLL